MKPIHLNLYIVDDDAALCRSLVSLLTAHFNEFSVRTFQSGEAFLSGADLDSCGVVILDWAMGAGMNGSQVFERMQEHKSPLATLFLSSNGTIPMAVRAMEGGAVSWLPKPCANEELVAVVQRAQERAVKIAAERQQRQKALLLWSRLSPREKQLAFPVSKAWTSKEISKAREEFGDDVQYRTVDGHRAKIFEKLELNGSNALQEFLRDHGLYEEALAEYSKKQKID
jgi:FixJ family two-component response regulator